MNPMATVAAPPLPRTPTVLALDARLRGPGSAARIAPEDVAALAAETGLDPAALLLACLPWAQRWAAPPISQFQVGAAALAESGAIYLGANLEFVGVALAQTVHAEQSAIALAKAHRETRLELLATSAAPCGYCRQFMLELADPPILILGDRGRVSLAELLPFAFGPAELGRTPELLGAGPHGLRWAAERETGDPLAELALAAADHSSAPYSGALAGVAVELADGSRFAGGIAESVAYNPTLGPMQAALIVAHHGGGSLDTIRDAVLVELAVASVSQRAAATALLASVAPGVGLRVASAGLLP
jgi:cytidine deaminase